MENLENGELNEDTFNRVLSSLLIINDAYYKMTIARAIYDE